MDIEHKIWILLKCKKDENNQIQIKPKGEKPLYKNSLSIESDPCLVVAEELKMQSYLPWRGQE